MNSYLTQISAPFCAKEIFQFLRSGSGHHTVHHWRHSGGARARTFSPDPFTSVYTEFRPKTACMVGPRLPLYRRGSQSHGGDAGKQKRRTGALTQGSISHTQISGSTKRRHTGTTCQADDRLFTNPATSTVQKPYSWWIRGICIENQMPHCSMPLPTT